VGEGGSTTRGKQARSSLDTHTLTEMWSRQAAQMLHLGASLFVCLSQCGSLLAAAVFQQRGKQTTPRAGSNPDTP
jgi:hypothetical protein